MAYPLLYEINTRCWLRRLSQEQGRAVTLADVPDAEIAQWQELGFTHVWAMGVWATGPRSRAVALNNAALRADFDKVLPGWTEEDVPGSPYAIERYEVPQTLGGNAGLRKFRQQLNARGLKLLLDFVPNHVGLDHSWLRERPELFVQSPSETPGTFRQETRSGMKWIAHGKDPNFLSWVDTAQLDYRRAETCAAMVEVLHSIASHCDGVRCDMAMLLLNDVFARTWTQFPGTNSAPATEFWSVAIELVKRERRDFLFLAEVYWDLEARLQSLGFDYTYCKSIYDRLLAHDYASVQKELLASSPKYVGASAHFLENHDEQRIATLLSPAEHRAAAVMTLGLPGMRLMYEGQLQGARVRTPVHLGRWPDEPVNTEIAKMYENVFAALKQSAVGPGDWQLLPPHGWPDNQTAQNFVVVQWQKLPEEFDLVVANLAPQHGQCRVRPAIKELAAHAWEMRDLLGTETYRCRGADVEAGLHFDLPPNGAQLFQFKRC